VNGPVAIRVYILSWNVLPRKKKYHTSSRKFGETELSQKATARYGTVAVYDLAVYTRLVVCSSRTPAEQTGICNDRCHAATRFSRRLIVPHHMDCPDNLECWWFNKATRLKRTLSLPVERNLTCTVTVQSGWPYDHYRIRPTAATGTLHVSPWSHKGTYLMHPRRARTGHFCDCGLAAGHAHASYMHGCDCYINYVYSAYVVLLIDRCTPLSLYICIDTPHGTG
jgi:hypothetical protein